MNGGVTCAHKDIFNMDHPKGYPSDDGGVVRMVNRTCLKCGQHWYGPEGQANEYTRAQWDAWMAAAFDEVRSA